MIIYNVLIFGVGVIIGAGVIWYLLKKPFGMAQGKPFGTAQGKPSGSVQGEKTFKERQIEEKEAGKIKILELFGSRARVSNDDVEKLLGVSDAGATRYLDELEKAEKIRQVGKEGRFVYYEKI